MSFRLFPPKSLILTKMGNPILRSSSKAVRIDRRDVQKTTSVLIRNMQKTMLDHDGVGLAAPQVNESIRVFLLDEFAKERHEAARSKKKDDFPITACINPKITKASPSEYLDWEACLSIPGLYGYVPRHEWVDVSYQNEEGVVCNRRLEGFAGRIFQHEFDHLNGFLYVDRLPNMKHLVMDSEVDRVQELLESGQPIV